jgi:hypothetical protein
MPDRHQLLFTADKMSCQATESFYIPENVAAEAPLLLDLQTCKSRRTEVPETFLRRTQEIWTDPGSASPLMLGWVPQILKPYQCQSACQSVISLLVTRDVSSFVSP